MSWLVVDWLWHVALVYRWTSEEHEVLPMRGMRGDLQLTQSGCHPLLGDLRARIRRSHLVIIVQQLESKPNLICLSALQG